MNYQIISDGACDLPADFTQRNNILIVPFYVTFDGETYLKEGEGIDHDSFYLKMIDEHLVPKTSLPSIQDYVDTFTPLVQKNIPIICITITAKFSGSYNSACSAKDIILESYPNAKITVIDSTLNTASQALFVNEACKMEKAGIKYEDCVNELNKIKTSGKIFFTVGSLEYLIKNGRIGKLAVIAGDKLGIRPTIIMKDGDISLGGISRSRKKSLLSVLNCIESFFKQPENNIKDYNFITASGYNFEEALEFTKEFEERLNVQCIKDFKVTIGTAIGCHTGPYALGVGILKKNSLVK